MAYASIKNASQYLFIFSLEYCFCVCHLCSLVVNVMQRDSIPSEVDYETRQGVYSICLQLARCDISQTHTRVDNNASQTSS